MRQNRANRPSNRQKFRSDTGDIHYKNHAKVLHFKEVPKEELERIKKDIREKSRAEQRKLTVVFIVVAVLVCTLMFILFY
ncbi:hypothetical protein [Ancylomarina subtilis]|nr:hypothetical protein [Ancylomarina subtilis]